MTSVQAESIKSLGAWHGGLFMAASKVLGEETVAGSTATADMDKEKARELARQRQQGQESDD